MAKIIFVVSDTEKLAVRSMGLPSAGTEFEPCPLNVGDLISYPNAPGISFRVVQRWYRAGDESKEGVWYLTLEYAGDSLEGSSHAP